MTETTDDVYREADKRIEAALREQAIELDLTSEVLQGRLTNLPQSVRQLNQLEELRLEGNALATLPPWVGTLTHLRWLDLRSNKMTALPAELGDLPHLETLILSGNNLRELPESLGRLTKLRSLYVSQNQLTILPAWIGRLSELETLYAWGNGLETLPSSLGKLTKLTILSLSDNRLTSLPASLTQLSSLEELALRDNPGLGLTEEILGSQDQPADPRAILAFYFSQQKKDARPLNEVKLLLVGHGRVGKTSISKALRSIAHNELEPETPGIERNLLPLGRGKSKITAHIWDFGGQEFLHQTHQFFFSERSIYLVVLAGRQGRPMQEAEYWLRLIRAYGTGSPVVIVLNQIKSHPFAVDEHFLQENYPEVQAVLKTDCYPRFGIDTLRKQLGKIAGTMPSVREKIEPSWARVRSRLEEMEASFVSFEEYRQICVNEGVTTPERQETLATILDCLGIALNYRNDPRLQDTSVLKPRWLVDGIYSILRWLQKHETNGELSLEDFPKALKNKRTYPTDMHKFLLALMEKFELCFPLDSDRSVFLVPGLLDANQPRELKRFLRADARRIQFRYEDVRPPGLLPRFIVRSHTLSQRQARWHGGVVLARGTARALVRGDHEGRVTDVFAVGEEVADRIWLTEFILSEMRILHDKLSVRTFVESEGGSGVWAELEILREEAITRGMRAERAADGSMVMVDARRTLRSIESREATVQPQKLPSVFICYSAANERAVRQLIPGLKVLARRGYIAPWRDTDLVPGEDWDDTIKQRLFEAQVILFMVSRNFLASHNITEYERPLAMELMRQKKAVVVPVILSDCLWQVEDFAGLESLPHKDKPVSAFSPRDMGWSLVEEGIVQVVKNAISARQLMR